MCGPSLSFASFVDEGALVKIAWLKEHGGDISAHNHPHGGALDRLDAVLFAAVAGYYIWAAYV